MINSTVTPTLLRHGEHVRHEYVSRSGVVGTAGCTTDADRRDGQVSGIVKRFAKDEQASEVPTSLNLLKTPFADAIEFTGITHQTRGALVMVGLFVAAMALGAGGFLALTFSEDGFDSIFTNVLLCLVLITIAGMLSISLQAIRAEFFRLEDEPVIFDRKNRRVYIMARDTLLGWRGMLRPWPIYAAEYDWDLIDAEHHALVSANGSTVNRYHSLHFLVRRSAEDPTIIDSFQVGTSLQVGAESAAPLWEHIRRFMEENGPHLPPGELLISEKAPVTLWQSMGAVGPLGPGYLRYWKKHTWVMVFFHLLFPLFLPMFLVWGLCNWLSYKTAIPVQWPQEVRDAVGNSIDHE